MTHKLRRKHVSSAIEKQILTAMIVSTQFNQEITHLLNFDYFTNSFIRKVARWSADFFESYEVAPFNHIQDIFNEKQVELPEEDAGLIQKILTDISTKYELNQGLNIPHSVDQALRFFKKRELEITYGNMGYMLEKGDTDGAEEQLNNFTKISRVVSGWIDPLEDQYVDEVFEHQERMFNFPGQLGDFLGGFDNDWLVAIAAGYKRGKSLACQELMVNAIQQRLKVAYFSLEMGRIESNDRFYRRVLGAGSAEGGPAIYPCFDCTFNQDGSCLKTERTNRIPLLIGTGKPSFSPNNNYRPCTACRFDNSKDYSTAWWFEVIDRPAYTIHVVKKQLDALRKVWPHLYRFKRYPKFSATLSDMRRDLDILERADGFVPNIIIIDQANGIKPEEGISLDGIAPHAAAWRGMASLTGERHAMVVSPTQITRAALEKKSVKQGDMAQWIGLLGDVDVAYSLGQTPEEKKEGVMRYNKLIHRHGDSEEDATCIVLQKVGFGQVYLDAQILYGSA